MTARTPNATAYFVEHPRCAICYHLGWLWLLHVHHLAGRKHPQSDMAANMLTLCARCHDQHHRGGLVVDGVRLPDLTAGMLLTAKVEADGFVNLAWLALLRYRKVLGYGPEPLPEFYLVERQMRTANARER